GVIAHASRAGRQTRLIDALVPREGRRGDPPLVAEGGLLFGQPTAPADTLGALTEEPEPRRRLRGAAGGPPGEGRVAAAAPVQAGQRVRRFAPSTRTSCPARDTAEPVFGYIDKAVASGTRVGYSPGQLAPPT